MKFNDKTGTEQKKRTHQNLMQIRNHLTNQLADTAHTYKYKMGRQTQSRARSKLNNSHKSETETDRHSKGRWPSTYKITRRLFRRMFEQGSKRKHPDDHCGMDKRSTPTSFNSTQSLILRHGQIESKNEVEQKFVGW